MAAVLVLNPNTTPSMLDGVLAAARRFMPGGCVVEGASAQRGVAVVASRAAYAIAAQSVLEIWARYRAGGHPPPAAAVVACFGDPGVPALRELAGVPVFGLAEAALRRAGEEFGRIAVVTAGQPWQAMLDELVARLALTHQYAGTFAADTTGLAGVADRPRFIAAMQDAIDRAQHSGARAIVLGGAALAGFAPEFRSSVRLVDGVDYAFAFVAAQLHSSAGQACRAAVPPIASAGLAPELAALLASPWP